LYAQRKTTRTREKYFGAAETEPKAPAAGNGGRKHESSEGRNRRWAAHEDYRAGLLDTYPVEIEEIQAHRSRTRSGPGAARIFNALGVQHSQRKTNGNLRMLEAAENRKQHTA
jgi:hypothetical protein